MAQGGNRELKEVKAFWLSPAEIEEQKKAIREAPEDVVGEKLTLQARNRDDFLHATITDYDEEKQRHELEYDNGQVIWIDLQQRVFKLDDPNEEQEEGGEDTSSLLRKGEIVEEQEQRLEELRLNVPEKKSSQADSKPEKTFFSFGSFKFFGGVQ